MNNKYTTFAQRIVAGLNVQPGELIEVRDHCDRPEIVREVLLAVDLAGATPMLDPQSPAYLNRWLAEATATAIQASSRHRLRWINEIDRVVVLGGGIPDFTLATSEPFNAWQQMVEEVTRLEEARQLPMIVVAVPNQQRADLLGMRLAELEAYLLPAHLLDIEECRRVIEEARAKVAGDQIIIQSGAGHLLHLSQTGRYWHGDDGVIDEQDRQHKTIVSNLPAGSIYTTVVDKNFVLGEDETVFFNIHTDYDYAQYISKLSFPIYDLYEALPTQTQQELREKYEAPAEGNQFYKVLAVLRENIEVLQASGVLNVHETYLAQMLRYRSILALMDNFFALMWRNPQKDTPLLHAELRRLLQETGMLTVQ
jgi:hypothetical protein